MKKQEIAAQRDAERLQQEEVRKQKELEEESQRKIEQMKREAEAQERQLTIEMHRQEMEMQKSQIQLEEDDKKRRIQAELDEGTKVVIEILDPEDVNHPYKAFLETGEKFKSQFGNMIKRNEELENELIRYRKKII